MIIESIFVEGFGTIRSGLTLSGLSNGLNIVYGPNEIGKSTLLNALSVGVFQKYNGTNRVIQSYIPWGTNVNPKIQIVFSSNGDRYKVDKQFHQNAFIRLHKEEHGQFLPFADGDAAEKRLRKLVGASDEDERDKGLTQLLWVPQGSKTFDRLPQTATKIIDAVLGDQIIDPLDRDILASVTTEHDLWIGTRVQYKQASGIPALQDEVSRLQQDFDLANEGLATIDQLATQVEQQETVLKTVRADLVGAKEDRMNADAALTELHKKHQKAETAKLVLVEAIRIHNEEKKRNQLITDFRAKIKRLDDETKTAIQNLAKDSQTIEMTLQLLANNQQHMDEAEQQLEAARLLLDLTEKKSRVTKLEEVVERWNREADKQKDIFDSIEKMNLPSPTTWEKIASTKKRFDALKAAIDTVASQMTFVAEKDGVHLSLYPFGKDVTLRSQEQVAWDVGNAFSLSIEGIGSITVEATKKQNILHEYDLVTEEIKNLLSPYGRTFREAEKDMEVAKEMMKQVALSKGKQQGMAASGIDEMQLEIRTIVSGIHQDQKIIFDQIQPGSKRHIEREIEELKELLATHKGIKTKREGEITKVRGQQEIAKHTISENTGFLTSYREQLDTLIAGETDEERVAKLKGFAQDVGNATKAYEELLVPEEEANQVEAWAESASNYLDNLIDAERSGQTLLTTTQTKLDDATSHGWYSRKANIEEKLALKFAELNERMLRAEGLKYLHETLSETMENTVRTLITPLAREVSQKIQQISGSRYDMVEFGDGFSLSKVHVRGKTETAVPDTLSHGMKEQLSLLVRLALGEIVSERERQLVVLDDPLVNTDPQRMKMTLQWLVEASKTMQIIVLTCHPSQYQRIAANFWNFEELKSIVS